MACQVAGQAPLLHFPVQACLPRSGTPCECALEGQSKWNFALNLAWLCRSLIISSTSAATVAVCLDDLSNFKIIKLVVFGMINKCNG